MTEEHVEKVKIPDGARVEIDAKHITVTGPKGSVRKAFVSPYLKMAAEGDVVVFSFRIFTKREKTLLGTYKAHLRNMFKGVTLGHEYEMKICSGHFPMTISYKDGMFSVRNYLGEKVPRQRTLSKDVEIKVEGDRVHLKGSDKDLVSQNAALIEQLTRRSRFDRRVFQDGIYIVKKDGKEIA